MYHADTSSFSSSRSTATRRFRRDSAYVPEQIRDFEAVSEDLNVHTKLLSNVRNPSA